MIGLAFRGHISADDLKALRVVTGEMMGECGRGFMVADMAECTGIGPGARKYMAEWSKQDGTDVPSCTGVYGLSFAIRAIMMLALNAIKLLGQREPDVVFLKDEAEAMRWVDEQRAALLPKDVT